MRKNERKGVSGRNELPNSASETVPFGAMKCLKITGLKECIEMKGWLFRENEDDHFERGGGGGVRTFLIFFSLFSLFAVIFNRSMVWGERERRKRGNEVFRFEDYRRIGWGGRDFESSGLSPPCLPEQTRQIYFHLQI